MKELLKYRILPQSFKSLYALPIYLSYVFGIAKRKSWRIKDDFTHIKKDKYKKPSNIIAIDQLISI